MTKAAGILFVSKKGTALFLKRGPTAPDCAGCWDFPGGGREGDESALECAERETREEIGSLPKGARFFHTRTNSSALKGVAGLGTSGVALPVAPDVPAATPIAPDVDFTTFIQHVDEEFEVALNDEHVGYAWAPVGSPPEPLHPGCRIALDRITMNELGVARAIADGRLTSPQKYENVWLFAIRITGTEFAFRPKVEEFVRRPPELYLNDEFLARCNGLPVIYKHPPKSLLDTDEFIDRIVGTVFLPYVAGDEVWAVAKIYVEPIARLMADGDLSTSPGVNFADFSVNRKMMLHLADGTKEKLLIEGEPSLLDHIAICELGVWDKGDEPSGIRSESREDSAMGEKVEDKAKDDAAKHDTKRDDGHRDDAHKDDSKKDARKDADEEKKEEKAEEKKEDARKDADAGHSLDKDLKHMLDGMMDSMKAVADSVSGLAKRMDAFEAKGDSRKDAEEKGADDPEPTIADKAKKDAAKKDEDEKKEEKKEDSRKDAKRDDHRLDSIDRRIDQVARMIPKDMTDDDYLELADARSRADDVFVEFAKRAPRPLQGETPMLYDRRVVRELQQHSPTWKDKNLMAIADDTFPTIRDQIFREARQAARNPVNIPDGQLRMTERKSDGHIIREFHGHPKSWMSPLAGATQLRGTGNWNTGNLGGRQ